MKQWYVSIAAFFSISALVAAQCIPHPLYAALAGAACALAAAVFLGMILSENAKSKLAEAARSESESQKRQDEMHRELAEQIGEVAQGLSSAEAAFQSVHSKLNELGQSLDQRVQDQQEACRQWTEQIHSVLSELARQESGFQDLLKQQGDSVNRNLVKLQEQEDRLHKEMLAEMARQKSGLYDMLKQQGDSADQRLTALCSQEEQLHEDTARMITEAADQARTGIESLYNLCGELSRLVAHQGKTAEAFFGAILKKPGVANDFSEVLKDIKDAAGELQEAVDDHPKEILDEMEKAVKEIDGLSASIDALREGLEQQSAENRETTQALVNSYSSVTEQDLSVLKALLEVNDNG